MPKERTDTEYANWVSTKFIYGPLIVSIPFLSLSLIWPVFAIVAAFFLLITAYFVYARYKFSARGGNIQVKLWELVLAHLDWNGSGKALDIGCGNGPLSIELAKRHPDGQVTGIDTWGKAWNYSKAACERNAQVAGLTERVNFQKASASTLPFQDESFDAVVSNFVFHDVSDTIDKRALVQEALRVLKKGGNFAFQDYFATKVLYGELDDLLETIRDWGITEVSFVDTSTSDFIPQELKLPFMLGKISILYGRK